MKTRLLSMLMLFFWSGALWAQKTEIAFPDLRGTPCSSRAAASTAERRVISQTAVIVAGSGSSAHNATIKKCADTVQEQFLPTRSYAEPSRFSYLISEEVERCIWITQHGIVVHAIYFKTKDSCPKA